MNTLYLDEVYFEYFLMCREWSPHFNPLRIQQEDQLGAH